MGSIPAGATYFSYSRMDVSIILVNYQTEKQIEDCVHSILQNTPNLSFEILVADNSNSQNPFSEKLPIKWIHSLGNLGFSKANNLAAKSAKGKYLLFLNPDTLLFQDSIMRGIEFLTSNLTYIACSGIQLGMDQQPLKGYNRLGQIRKDLYLFPSANFLYDRLEKWFEFKSDIPTDTDFLSGAFILLTKDDFQELGGWDSQFFLYGEDAELSFRMRQKGKLALLPQLAFIHLEKENEFRKQDQSFINRFDLQIQLSNFLWIRKSYGILSLMTLYLNYHLIFVLYWLWKLPIALFKKGNFQENISHQKKFSQKLHVLNSWFFALVFLSKTEYRIIK